jgi:peptidyl-prolyl cis-trans isomerase B (cyclophilin B)
MTCLRHSAGRALTWAALLLGFLFITPACEQASAPTAPPATPAPSSPVAPVAPAVSIPSTPAALFAVFTQRSGVIRVRLAATEAPRLCMGFILLAERGYFANRPWHDFSPVVRQLGESPPVFSVPREFSPKLLFDKGGLLCASNTSDDAKARAKPNRIFLTVKEQDRWNLQYVVFGTIESGLDVAQALGDGETVEKVVIEGDASVLRARCAKDIPEWSKAIDAAMQASSR